MNTAAIAEAQRLLLECFDALGLDVENPGWESDIRAIVRAIVHASIEARTDLQTELDRTHMKLHRQIDEKLMKIDELFYKLCPKEEPHDDNAIHPARAPKRARDPLGPTDRNRPARHPT